MWTHTVKSLLVTLTAVGFIHNIVLCWGENTIENLCCLPVFNCPPGHYVKTCTQNNTQDVCTICRDGVQPNFVSSFDTETRRNCFVPTDIYQCPETDTVHSREPYPANWCPHKCRCDIAKCFWGTPCICNKRNKMCKENEELDSVTGECHRCPEGKIKKGTGCGPCIVDVDKRSKAPYLVHDHNKTQATEGTCVYSTHTSSVTKQSTPETIPSKTVSISTESVEFADQSNDGHESNSTSVFLIVLVCVGILTVSLLILVIYLCYRMRRLQKNNGTRTTLPLTNGIHENLPLNSTH